MPQRKYQFCAFTVDLDAHKLLRGGMQVALQEQPFQVLLALLEEPGKVVTREALRARLWGTDTFVDFDQSLNSAVRRLRLALGDNSREPSFIETLPRVGFRFLAEVKADQGTMPATEQMAPRRTAPFQSVTVIKTEHPREQVPNRTFPTVLAGVFLFVAGLLLGQLPAHFHGGGAHLRIAEPARAVKAAM